MVILHLATRHAAAAALIVTACGVPVPRLAPGVGRLLALTSYCVIRRADANLGAMASCGGFPLCNGQIIPHAGPLAAIHWTHRCSRTRWRYLTGGWYDRRIVAVGIARDRRPAIAIAATMIQLGFPGALSGRARGSGSGSLATV